MEPVFREIQSLVTVGVTERNGSHPSILKELLLNICSITNPAALIRTVLSSEEHVDNVSKLSYKHINGFDKIVLLNSEKRLFKLRLHIWWPTKTGQFREHIHNHRWNFATNIFLGCYRLETYVRSKEGEPVYSYSYWSPEELNTYRMVLKGRAHANKILEADISKGTIYQLEHSVLHRVTQLTRSGTVSLVLQGQALKNKTSVLTDSPVVNPSTMPATRFSVNEIVNKLENCLALLGCAEHSTDS